MSKSYLKHLYSVVMMLVFLRMISTSSSELTVSELVNSEVYKTFLNNVLKRQVPATQQRLTDESNNKLVKEEKNIESPYERVLRNLRSNWEMPMNYLQERGYFKDLNSKKDNSNNDLSMDAYNLINGPLLNPSTSNNVFPIPQGPNSFLSTKADRIDRAFNAKVENDGAPKTRSYDENISDCSDPSNTDLACFNQFFGENWAKSVKDKWDTLFHKNQSTTPTPPTTTTITNTPTTTTSNTTSYPISNKTTEVISDLSLQDARDGLEFFKIYNDFMLAKLTSKLSQDAHERRMLHSSQNQVENQPPVIQDLPTQAPLVPDFSNIDDNDIRVLKELDSCLKNKKTSTNLDANVPIVKDNSADGSVNDVPNDRRVSATYLPTKLKFLAHLHHDVFNIGQNKPLRKTSVNYNGCNVDITQRGTTN